MKKNRKKIIIIILALLVVFTIVIGNINKNNVKPINVQIEKVEQDKIVQMVNASGSLSPVIQVRKSSKVSARIINITVKEGDLVQEGQLLVELDRTRYEAAYDMTVSGLESSKANYKKVKNELKRSQELFNSNLISESELESAKATSEIAKSQVDQAKASLKQAKDDLDQTRIISSMAGKVTLLNKEIGEMAVGSTFQEDVILIISDMSRMEVQVNIDETDIVDINIGDTTKIEIDALPDTVFTGIVSEIAHSATIKGQGTQEQVTSFQVKIDVLGQDKRFRPGMSSTVDIITDTKNNALVIPIQALTVRKAEDDSLNVKNKKNESLEVVFVVNKKEDEKKSGLFSSNKSNLFAEQREVKVGISSDTHFEVKSGLELGEEIVIGSYKAISKELKDNSPLEISDNKDKGEKK